MLLPARLTDWGLRDYGVEGQLGLEKTPEEFIAKMVKVFHGVRRVLRDDGTVWLNLGDSYAGGGGYYPDAPSNKAGSLASRGAGNGGVRTKAATRVPSGLKHKDLCMMPARVALALQADGWYLRSAMPWVKRSPMPESTTDRPNSALEYIFMLTKKAKYYFDMEAVRRGPSGISGGACFGGPLKEEKAAAKCSASLRTQQRAATKEDRERYASQGRNFRNGDLWFESIESPHGMVFYGDEMVGIDVVPRGFADAHFATFPPDLIRPMILAGTSEKGCCPECGALWERVMSKPSGGTTGKSWQPHIDDMKTGNAGGKFGQKAWDTYVAAKTLGWRPTCKCGKEPVPCICFDPFMGAGTTAVVAAQNGRDYIGIELNQEYIDMANKRIEKECVNLFWQGDSK